MAYEELFNQYLANRSPEFGGPVDTSANVQPKSTTITYNPDGTQTVTEKKEITPEAPTFKFGAPEPIQQIPQQAPQPVAPEPVTAPVVQAPPVVQPQAVAPVAPQPMVAPQPVPSAAPDQNYQRMIQAESGGQNFAPNGQPLTSPKGAMFAAQVMPATAQNPGYGVRPAQAQTPEEYNRVGQDYYNAMLKQFGGNQQAATAAYNAGPGRVQQNMQQNQGQLNVAQLPQETQQYLQRVQPGQPAPAAGQPPVMIAGNASSDVGFTPTEQAIRQQRPPVQQPAMVGTNMPPAIPPVSPDSGPAAGAYRDMTGQTPTEATWHEYYGKEVVNNLADPVKLAQIYKDPNAPEFAKIAAARQTAELMSAGRDQQTAIKKVDEDLKNGNTVAIADALKKRTDEGSYIKAYLFQRLGLTELAQEEQGKLGAGRVWEQNTLSTGETALIQRDRQGMPLYGISQTGVELTPGQLIQFGGAPVKGAAQHAQVYKDPFGQIPGNFALETRPGRAPVFREIGTGRLASPDEAKRLNAVGVAGPLEQIYASKYLAGGGTKQGQAAAEGFAVGPLPGAPGYVGQPGGAPTGTTPGVTPAGAPLAPTVQQINPAIPTASTIPTGTVAQQRQALEIGGKRTESFNKIIDTEYRDNAGKGEIVSSNRKQQFDILNRDDPATGKKVAEQISGLYTAANENPKEQKYSIIRDIFGGQFKPEAEVSQRLAQLNLSPAMKSALTEYNALNAQIAGQTLRETAGPGSVSDAEQAANRARNVDITKTPMLGAYNMMGQSQFSGDLQRYKADLAASPNNTATNATQFDSQFRRHSAELVKSYREVAEARLKYIQDLGSTPTAIREGYKRYPVPEYDVQTGNWKYLKPLDQIFKKKEQDA